MTRRPVGGDWREARRLRALPLLEKGMKQSEVARAVGVTPGAVAHWAKAVREGGRGSLNSRPHMGRTPRIPRARVRDILIPTLRKGARALGFPDDRWTWARVAEVIERELGVKYHRSQVQRILTQLGWSIRRGGGRRRGRADFLADLQRQKRRGSRSDRAQ